MRYLFLDNYRGFKNTSIPLLDVNFLVGENSTGKTSLLTILSLLSNPQTYMGQQSILLNGLPTELTQFGRFNEIVSAHSADRSYFRVGLANERVAKSNKKIVNGILLTYKESDGLPKISKITATARNMEVSVLIQEKTLLYRIKKLQRTWTIQEMNDQIIKWAQYHADGSYADWEELKAPLDLTDPQVPIVMILSLAATQMDATNSEGFSFVFPDVGPPLVWIAPIRTNPRRTYDEPHTAFSSEGLHTPYVIKRMLDSESEAIKFKGFMERVGKSSGLFQEIQIKKFGDEKDSPFEVDAVLDGKALSLRWLGYGLSQSLPILVELLDRPKRSWFAIQQPEVHLHPRAQASLGDVFFEMASRDSKTFLVETHSDFTIDRFRMNFRRRRKNPKLPESQILFFERKERQNTITPISIGPSGDISSDQPENYRKFFIKEEMNLLGIR